MQIKIVNKALITPLGDKVETCLNAFLDQQAFARPISRFPVDELPAQQGGQLPDELEAYLRDNYDEDDLCMALIRKAGEDALQNTSADGLVLASNFGLLESREWCWRERLDVDEVDEESYRRQQAVIQRAKDHFKIDGPATHLTLSCASGAAALSLARDWLLAERCRRVLVICYDGLTEFCWTGLANLRTISPDKLLPFDQNRQGTIFSEGAAAVLLSTTDDDEAEAFLYSAATNNNAFHLTAPPKDACGSRRVMEESLRLADMDAASIDLISAHATGTQANDKSETIAIHELCGRKDVPVMALKSGLGHLLGAAGLAEMVLGLMALKKELQLPVQRLEDQDENCDVNVVREKARHLDARVLISNSAGIGGNNAASLIGLDSRDLPTVEAGTVYLKETAWVLPAGSGTGTDLPLTDPGDDGQLADFSVKSLLSSVKGYLDPAAVYTLGAAAMCLANEKPADPARTGVVFVTQYGATLSSFRFFQQLYQKGHRYASPMIFPHSYSNTAANLVAIEFGLAGPHLVFDFAEDIREAAWAAEWLIQSDQADDVLLIACEAAIPEVVPWPVLNGAVCFWLSSSKAAPLPAFDSCQSSSAGILHGLQKLT